MESTTRGNQDDKSVTTSKNETNTTNRRENGKSPRSSHKESATGEGSAAVEASDPHGEGTKLGHYIVGKYSSFFYYPLTLLLHRQIPRQRNLWQSENGTAHSDKREGCHKDPRKSKDQRQERH